MRSTLIVVACAIGCGNSKAPPRFEGPMPVTLGACAGPATKFVSGPRPMPFTEADIAASTTRTAARSADDDPPPPPEDAADESPASALDEGKMGKPGTDDAKLARQQAIEAARSAGILGSLTPIGDAGGGEGGAPSSDDSGFGPATGFGSVTGLGTAGTGRYGTITGNGVQHHAAVPTVAIGQANANGDLDKAIIRRYVKRNLSKIQYCYEKQLLAKPGLGGTVKAAFFITTSGEVSTATASGVDPEVASCVAGVLKSIEFPKPRGGGGVQVNYPFTFRTAGSDATRPTPPPAVVDQPIAPPEPPAPPVTTPPSGDNSGHDLFRSAYAPRVDASRYRPGTKNPLDMQTKALEACFRGNPAHFGAVVFELKYDAAGAVTTAKVDGIADATTNACLVAAAKLVKHPGTQAENCGVAFGEMQLADLPAIEIGTANVTFGKLSLPIRAIVADASPTTKIADLQAAVADTVKAAMSAPISLHGPIVIRPEDATPMKVVVRVLGSVIAGGDDFVLARHEGATWQPLYQLTLPIVPVPVGTGGKWNPVKNQSRSGGGADHGDQNVRMSLLVTKQQIWVGLSRISEFQELPVGADQLAKLVATLKEHKASAFFADRADLEIAAEDDITYGEVLAVIAKAREAGFVDWSLTNPSGLSAVPTL